MKRLPLGTFTAPKPIRISVTALARWALGMACAIILAQHYLVEDPPLLVKIALCYLGGQVGMIGRWSS